MNSWSGKWIMDPEFRGLPIINTFHKQKDISDGTLHRTELQNRHMLIRKTFELKKVDTSCYIKITADDYYKLYVNGQFVGQGPAPAYYTAYNYNEFDLHSFLKVGRNSIAVHVYYQGLVNRVWNSGDHRQGMIAEVVSEGVPILWTDQSWKFLISTAYQSGGIIGYDTQFLENMDSRLWDPEWVETNYDDGHWSPVCEYQEADYTLCLQPTKNLSVYTVKAKEWKKISNHHYWIDFGQEITGQFLLKAKGQAGDQIEIRCGEELEEEPSADGQYGVRYKMRCNCTYQEFWTLSGQMDQLTVYDYKAFRYVEIIAPNSVRINEDFEAIVRHYPFEEDAFRFISSNPLLDQIVKVCKNGVKYGAQEVFVDCPTREKGQYLGDFTITGHSHMYLTGETELYKKALQDFARSAVICPGIMAVAPGGYMQEIADFSLQWPMQIYQYYLQTGDKHLVEALYPQLENLEAYFHQFQRVDGLLEQVDEKWNLVDWPDNLRDNYDCDLTNPIGQDCHNVINAFYFGMMSYAEKIREILAIKPVYDLEGFKQSFHRVFYDTTTRLFIDREFSKHSAVHSNALPLLFGLFYDVYPHEAINLIKTKAHKCGVYMSYFILKSLASIGEYEAIFDLIESLWSTMVKEGATTCFEAWGKNQKWNTSLCHPWASGAIPIMIEDIIGLKPGTPGWEKISFTPHVPERLENFCCEFSVKTGRIKVEKKNGKIHIEKPEHVELIESSN